MKNTEPIGPQNIKLFSKVSMRITELEYLKKTISPEVGKVLLTPMQEMSNEERGRYLVGLIQILSDDLREEDYLDRARVYLEQFNS